MDRLALCGVVPTFLANASHNLRSQLLYKLNIEIEMKELGLHEQCAFRDDQEDGNAVVEKWCINPHLYYFPSEELKFKPRLDRSSSEPPIFDCDVFMENHVSSPL